MTGLVTGATFAAAAGFADWFGVDRIREVFIQITEALIEFVTFGLGVPAGLLVLVAASAAGGAVGAFARTAPATIRKPAMVGLSAVLLLGLLQRIVPIVLVQLGVEADWLYSPVTRGLTWLGAALIFVVAAGADVVWNRSGSSARQRIRTGPRRQAARLGLLVALFAVLMIVPLLLGTVISEVLGQVMIYVLLGLGLNIVVGYAGLLDLGYVAFFAFGAYTTGLLTGAFLNTSTGAAEPRSGRTSTSTCRVDRRALAAGVGVLIGAPVLRLRGDYLAIVTLGLGEIVSIITASRWAQPLIGGPQGMRGVTKAEIFGIELPGQPTALLLPGARRSSCWRYSSPGGCPPRASGGRGTRCARTSRSPTRWGSARRSTSCWRSRWAARSARSEARCSRSLSVRSRRRASSSSCRSPPWPW